MRFLVDRSKKYSYLRELLTAGQVRGCIDASTGLKNPDSKHKVRLSYVYAYLGFHFAGIVAIPICGAIAVFQLHEGDLAKAISSACVCLLSVVALWSRRLAAEDIERAEGLQHALAVVDKDGDWEMMRRVLEVLASDVADEQVSQAGG